MVIDNSMTLKQALAAIQLERSFKLKIESGKHFQPVLWNVLDLLNERYWQQLPFLFDHYNWVNHNLQDEVAYFLNEAASNAFNYSELKIPAAFQLWMGKRGFVLGVSQFGQPFNANAIKPGGGFAFFSRCRCAIFLDDFCRARTIYAMYRF